MDHDSPADPIEHARRLFLDPDHVHGCAETVFVALKGAYGLDDPDDAAPAMALNGGIAYSGGTCGAVSGAALALGMLAGRRLADHGAAKRVARELTAELMDAFRGAFHALDCRALIGVGLRTPEEHAAFLASDLWRDRCMRQIEFAVAHAAPLADEAAWRTAVTRIEAGRDRDAIH